MKKIMFFILALSFVLIGCPQSITKTTTTTTTIPFEGEDIVQFSPTPSLKKLEYVKGEDDLDLLGLTYLIKYQDKTKKILSYNDETKKYFKVPDIKKLDVGTQKVKCYFMDNFSFDVTITIIKARKSKNPWELNDIPSDYEINHDFWDNASVYFVLTDRFYNGNTSNDASYGRDVGKMNEDPGMFWGGDIAGLTAKLDYIESTGATAIWFTAPYEQIHGWAQADTFKHYSYHGYYAMDWTQMDANMGTVEEFRTFVDEAHKRGIRVVMDIVMNHPGYATIHDMYYLGLNIFSDKFTGLENVTLANYHNNINYKSHGFDDWWGGDWVRAGLCDHYSIGSGEIDGSQASLPDFKTGSQQGVGIPKYLTSLRKNMQIQFNIHEMIMQLWI